MGTDHCYSPHYVTGLISGSRGRVLTFTSVCLHCRADSSSCIPDDPRLCCSACSLHENASTQNTYVPPHYCLHFPSTSIVPDDLAGFAFTKPPPNRRHQDVLPSNGSLLHLSCQLLLSPPSCLQKPSFLSNPLTPAGLSQHTFSAICQADSPDTLIILPASVTPPHTPRQSPL